jgi:elongation factor 2
MPNFTID